MKEVIKMLTMEEKAQALNLAMRFEIMGYEGKLFDKFIEKLINCSNPHFKFDLLNFLKGTNTMTQRLYFESIYRLFNYDETKRSRSNNFIPKVIEVFGEFAVFCILGYILLQCVIG